MNSLQSIQKLDYLPSTLPLENAVRLELEQGVIIFRASDTILERIETLLGKRELRTAEEERELLEYEEIDDYLSYVNRLIRNLSETSEVNLVP